MADIAQVVLPNDATVYNIKDIVARQTILYGECDNTSVATAFTATVPGVTSYQNGTTVLLKNGVVTSAAATTDPKCFTLNINGLGAKPVYSSAANNTYETTTFNVAYTMLFIYNPTIFQADNPSIVGGWVLYRGSGSNTIGYQIRSNYHTLPITDKMYRYRIAFTSADNTHFVPSNSSTSTNATAKRDVAQTPINPFGRIVYYSTTTALTAAEKTPAKTVLWDQYNLTLGYSFNRTGAALSLAVNTPVYIKCAPQADGSAIIDADNPYVLSLPNTEDGKIYIFLGITYNTNATATTTTTVEMLMHHPIYYYKSGAIRLWTNSSESAVQDVQVNGQSVMTNHIAEIDLTGYYPVTGGNIAGNLDLDGTFKFNIPDDDYVVDITATPRLDQNRGTILSLSGQASGTPYKVVLENIGTPVNNNDAATKKYVDDLCSIVWITGLLDSQGLVLSSDAYTKAYDAVTSNKTCFIKLTATDGVHILRLKSWIDYNSHSTQGDSFRFEDEVDGRTTKSIIVTYNNAVYSETTLEVTSDKVSAWSATPDDTHYPTEKLVKTSFAYIETNYTKNPVLIYDKTLKLQVPGTIVSSRDSAAGLINQAQGEGTNRDVSDWNITDMDLSAFRRLRVVACRNNANYATTCEFNIPLDCDPVQTRNIFVSGVTISAYGDRNRLNTMTCAVDSAKSKFCVTQTFSLYGTAVTAISDFNVTQIWGEY